MANSQQKEGASTSSRRRRTLVPNQKKITDDEFMAAAIGDVEWLRQSMREKKGQIHFDKNGLAAIHLAALHGRRDCLKLLIEKYKENVNLPSSHGWKPIHLCISNQTGKRSFQCLAYLLDKGADPSCVNDDNITPAHQAASEGHIQCLKLLLEVGAKIGGRDCRGHLPIDLAKLWGHRNCARLLAAETWHKEKDSVAKEIGHLKKAKMQQLLKELEQEDEVKRQQTFYGDDAFKSWMLNKGLQPVSDNLKETASSQKKKSVIPKSEKSRSTGPTRTTEVEFEDWRESDLPDGLMKPNSVATGRSTMFGRMAKVEGDGPVGKAETPGTYRSVQTPLTLRTEDTLINIHENQDETTIPNVIDEESRGFHNPNEWNKSTFVPDKEYVLNLKDAYPRDNYTCLPRPDAAPEYLIPSVVDMKKLGIETPSSMKPELLRRRLQGGVSESDRKSVLYGCKNIVDAQEKKKYHPDELGNRSEIGLHLVMDTVDSDIFVNSLQRELVKDSARSSSTHISGLSDISKWRGESFPVDRIINTMKTKLTKPDHFPAIRGQEYDINYGQYAIL